MHCHFGIRLCVVMGKVDGITIECVPPTRDTTLISLFIEDSLFFPSTKVDTMASKVSVGAVSAATKTLKHVAKRTVKGAIKTGMRLAIHRMRGVTGVPIPMRAHASDAGLDIRADLSTRTTDKVIIRPGTRALIGTGLRLRIPHGYYGSLRSRSGLAAKYGIDVGAGVIDSGYEGEVKVLLINSHPHDNFTIVHGDRIAQLLILPCALPIVDEVTADEYHALGNVPGEAGAEAKLKGRGDGGFGSTGRQ